MVWEQLKFVKFNDEQHKEDKTMDTEIDTTEAINGYKCRLLHEKHFQLYKVPEKYRTLELCTIGVKKWGKELREVPEELINAELCESAVFSSDLNDLEYIEFVPERFKTYDFVLRTLKYFHKQLDFININTRTITAIAASTKNRVFEFSHNGYKFTITKED